MPFWANLKSHLRVDAPRRIFPIAGKGSPDPCCETGLPSDCGLWVMNKLLADKRDTYQTVAEKAAVRVAQYQHRKRRGRVNHKKVQAVIAEAGVPWDPEEWDGDIWDPMDCDEAGSPDEFLNVKSEMRQKMALGGQNPQTRHKSRTPPVAASAEQRRYLQPSPPGLGLLSLLSRAARWSAPWNVPLFLPFILLQMLRKVLCIGRRNTTPIATEGTAQPDSRPTELQAKAGGSTALTACTGNSARAMADHRAKADVALSEGMAIANHTTTRTPGIAKTGTMPTLTAIHAPTQHFTKGVSSQQQVPAMVRDIHQRLVSHVTVDARLQTDILRLAEEHPADVVMTLLGCAPSCDRFVVQTLKALLCRLWDEDKVVALERKHVWDTLLCPDTQHYAVGLLAR
ncbi:PREDICTED: uncharacterized protein LOC108445429 [Corvus brachyrhynchos]|uniref:uncharacterized protein LOC108445429 n=1 Tax=Corvus brachyrhynchos TaxID=85066 RepID=UPI0008167E60|nr:PREDICTED: uncharacterized protein LOC108445429 [Corvus brachyrhynchos]